MITLVDAGPGSGKTWTLVHNYLYLKREILGRVDASDEQNAIFDYVLDEYTQRTSCCYFTHSNSVKSTLKKRLFGKAKVYTFHGCGYAILNSAFGYQQRSPNRTDKHIQELVGIPTNQMNNAEKWNWLACKKLVKYFKTEDLEPTEETYDYLRLKYPDLGQYRFPVDWKDRCQELLSMALRRDGVVDYEDMLWFANKVIKTPKYDLGFVDESQDISRSAYNLLKRVCKNLFLTGDKNQAIKAFAGASEEMYDFVAGRSDAILPLKLTRRCPPHICQRANTIRPDGIVSDPSIQDGITEGITLGELPKKLGDEIRPDNTLIVSRTNAGLVNLAIRLHKQEIPCIIMNQDLADSLYGFCKSQGTKDLKTLSRKIEQYRTRMEKARNPLWARLCVDKANSILEILRECKSYDEIKVKFKETFEQHPDGYQLNSIHGAKGLEAENIMILDPPVEMPEAMKHPISREQEINLHFVALTRSSKNLYWITK